MKKGTKAASAEHSGSQMHPLVNQEPPWSWEARKALGKIFRTILPWNIPIAKRHDRV